MMLFVPKIKQKKSRYISRYTDVYLKDVWAFGPYSHYAFFYISNPTTM